MLGTRGEQVVDLRDGVGTTGNSLLAALALPDTNSLALDGVLSAEGADVAGVLGDFHLLHLLTQGGTVSVMNKPCQPTILALPNSIFHALNSGFNGVERIADDFRSIVRGARAKSIPGTIFTRDTDL
jgi:hypothetical protein